MFSEYNFYSPVVLAAIILFPAAAGTWNLAATRYKLAFFFWGIAAFAAHLVMVVLAEADWIEMLSGRLYDDASTLETSQGWGLLPQWVFNVPIITGLVFFVVSLYFAWREKRQWAKWNDETHEGVVPDGAVNPHLH
jgi:hypothetical protein